MINPMITRTLVKNRKLLGNYLRVILSFKQENYRCSTEFCWYLLSPKEEWQRIIFLELTHLSLPTVGGGWVCGEYFVNVILHDIGRDLETPMKTTFHKSPVRNYHHPWSPPSKNGVLDKLSVMLNSFNLAYKLSIEYQDYLWLKNYPFIQVSSQELSNCS